MLTGPAPPCHRRAARLLPLQGRRGSGARLRLPGRVRRHRRQIRQNGEGEPALDLSGGGGGEFAGKSLADL